MLLPWLITWWMVDSAKSEAHEDAEETHNLLRERNRVAPHATIELPPGACGVSGIMYPDGRTFITGFIQST